MSTATRDRGLRIAYESRSRFCVRLGVLIRSGKVTTGYHVKSESDDLGWVVGWSREDGHGDYTVIVDHVGKATKCNCPARVRCKHMDASEVLIQRELL